MSNLHSPGTLLSLYVTLVCSKLSYCTQIWRPHLVRDIRSFESLQHRATKFILRDYTSYYKDRLQSLKLLPLSLWFDYLDLMFLVKSLKDPQDHFNIYKYIQFITSYTRSSSHSKLKCILPFSSVNNINFIYFNWVVKIWNSLPPIDIDHSTSQIKQFIKCHLWDHFLQHFDSDCTCTWHIICPCSRCSSLSYSFNYSFS